MARDSLTCEWARMLPHEIEEAAAECPTAFVPLGTLEWHGVHNPLGLDALKAHALCVQAAERGGGVVLPPLYGGLGGVEQPWTIVMESESTLFSRLLEPWLRALCSELKRLGFRAIILLTGHYGAAQQVAVRETAVRESQRLAIPILGTPEHWLALDKGYTGDHGGPFETSLMLHLMPESVDLSRLRGAAPFQGISGDPARNANAAWGRRVSDTIVARLAHLAQRMPRWNETQRTAFIRAEQALVNHQVEAAGRDRNVWAAWRDGWADRFSPYGQLLVDEEFESIRRLADH